MRKLIVLATALPLGLAAAPAFAGPGCELGGGIGYSTDIASATSFDGLGLHSTQPDAQIRGECGYQFQTSPFYLGLYGEYEWRNVQFSASTFKAALTDGYGFGGRIGYRVSSSAMPYVGGGYVHRDIAWSTPSPTLPTGMDGFKLSGGVEFTPFQNVKWITLAPEVTYTDYSDITVGRTTIKNKELGAMVRLNVALFAPGQTDLVPLK